MTTIPKPARPMKLVAQGLLGLGACTALIWGVALSIESDVQAQIQEPSGQAEPAREIDPVVYSHAQSIRRYAALSSGGMAAMGMTQAEAEAVLTRLADWCETNQERLDTTQRAVYVAERELEMVKRRIRTGQSTVLAADMRNQATRQQAVQAAVLAQQALKMEAGRTAMQGASGKSFAWERAAALPGDTPVAIRFMPFMDATRLAQLKEQAKTNKASINQAMSFSEQQDLAETRLRITASLPGVSEAEAAAMPVPAELKSREKDLAGD